MPRRHRLVLGAVFGATGFAALCLQVVWQRVVSLHAGVDLVSFTTIIAAFLAGLGAGNLLGGALADRFGPRGSLLVFAVANLGIGLYAWVSVDLLYDGYRAVAEDLHGAPAKFAFNVALLLVPTVLMGLSLPLVAKGVVERTADAGPLVGRLYAINTVGAAVGAFVSGWFLVGAFGFTATVRIAGTINLLAAIAVFTLWRAETAALAPAPPPAANDVPATRVWPWFVVYGLTGAVALGFELVFFRLVDALMRSNSYSFPHVLFLYLSLFGIGSAVGARWVGRRTDPARTFLGLQFGVGLAALTAIVLLVQVAPALGAEKALRSYFCCDGFNTGFSSVDSPTEWAKVAFAYVLGPLFLMGLPVFLMGASFPFVQALVNERLDTLGRRTGVLLTANIVGNVVGTLLVGLVLLHHLGTVGTAMLLAALLLVPGIAAALRAPVRKRRLPEAIGAVALLSLAVVAMPSNTGLWAFFHGADESDLRLEEERSCVITAETVEDGLLLFVNASSQNGHPFDDFHVLIGLTPALLHDQPDEALAVGLGIGSTPWSMALDDRVEHLESVEICGGQIDMMHALAADGFPEMEDLVTDDRVALLEGNGRDHLLRTDRRYDLVNIDTLRPQSAFSGSLYSTEFYELVQSRLADGGVLAQWVSSDRTWNSATEVFPHVLVLPVHTYGSSFFLASDEPIEFDREEIVERFESLPDDAFSPEQRQRLAEFFATVQPLCAADGSAPTSVPDASLNHDLHPRDEYFLNQPTVVGTRATC